MFFIYKKIVYSLTNRLKILGRSDVEFVDHSVSLICKSRAANYDVSTPSLLSLCIKKANSRKMLLSVQASYMHNKPQISSL